MELQMDDVDGPSEQTGERADLRRRRLAAGNSRMAEFPIFDMEDAPVVGMAPQAPRHEYA
eukprot:7095547-Heterocapsa_arctica.AAC.1